MEIKLFIKIETMKEKNDIFINEKNVLNIL